MWAVNWGHTKCTYFVPSRLDFLLCMLTVWPYGIVASAKLHKGSSREALKSNHREDNVFALLCTCKNT